VIRGLIGRPGAGKTYDLTRRVLNHADRGGLVCANYYVDHPNVVIFEPEHLLDLPPSLVVIDEAHLWFPARMSLKLPMSWMAKMSQTRKSGWNLIWSAQHETRVDRLIRDVSDWLTLSSAWGWTNGHPRLFTTSTYEPERFRKKGQVAARSMSFYSSRIANSYDTLQRITQAAHTAQKDDPYARSRSGGSVLDGVLK
jgi:hypothetical protein